MIEATNYASVIRPLQLIVLAVAGLFLLRVMRVAIVEVRPPRTEKIARTKRRTRLSLEVLEPDEHVGERVEVDSPITIGRGVECDVVINDTYISTKHARFSLDEGDLLIEDLGSTNGTYVNQELIKHRTLLEKGDIVQVGGVLLEVVR